MPAGDWRRRLAALMNVLHKHRINDVELKQRTAQRAAEIMRTVRELEFEADFYAKRSQERRR
jgi:hypothetical protein